MTTQPRTCDGLDLALGPTQRPKSVDVIVGEENLAVAHAHLPWLRHERADPRAVGPAGPSRPARDSDGRTGQRVAGIAPRGGVRAFLERRVYSVRARDFFGNATGSAWARTSLPVMGGQGWQLKRSGLTYVSRGHGTQLVAL